MRVWRRDASGSRQPQAFIDLTSKQGAVEVGGGPWWSAWSAQVIATRRLQLLSKDTSYHRNCSAAMPLRCQEQ